MRNKMRPCNEGGQNCNNSSQQAKSETKMLKFNKKEYFSTRDHNNMKHCSFLYLFSRDFGTGIAFINQTF